MENSQHDEAQRIIAVLAGALAEVVRELVKAQITEMAKSGALDAVLLGGNIPSIGDAIDVHLESSDYLHADSFDISDYLDTDDYLTADSFDISDYADEIQSNLDVSELDLSDAIDCALRDMLNDDALVVRLAR